MLSLYEILKASKTGIAPDMWTALAGANFGGAGSGAEVKELTGIPPLSFTANGTPLLDFLISGNMSQTGTPTPDNPIQPQETGERTAQLFDKDNTTLYNLFPGMDNTIRVSSNARSIAIPCVGGETYTVSKKAGQRFMVCFTTEPIATQVTYTELTTNNTATSITVVAPLEAKYLFVYFYNSTADVDTVETLVNSIMINIGSTALPYEPYGYKIPISSGDTTTNIYLGEVETTRKIRQVVLTGQETYVRESENDRFYTEFPNAKVTGLRLTQVYCTHFLSVYDGRPLADVPNNSIYSGSADSNKFYIKTTNYTTVADFTAYLARQYAAGTPVTVWYVLATPQTAVVNEPLMRIGDYADTLSMEQAGVSIPTVKGNTVIDVETTLKPSEMYIKYKG